MKKVLLSIFKYKKIAKLYKLRDLHSLEKQNRRKRIEDKLRQRENYGEIEELFDLLTKTLNTNKHGGPIIKQDKLFRKNIGSLNS